MNHHVRYVYILKDPHTNEIVYVGRTNHVRSRFVTHKNGNKNTPVGLWCLELRSQGLEPIMEVIETCNNSNIREREYYWIDFFGESGKLFNINTNSVLKNQRVGSIR